MIVSKLGINHKVKKSNQFSYKENLLGYKVLKIPQRVYEVILSERQDEAMELEECKSIDVIINCHKSGQETHLIPFHKIENVWEVILADVLPILEQWANMKLDTNNGGIYGIRQSQSSCYLKL